VNVRKFFIALNNEQLRKELVINRPFIWRAGWSIVAMRLFLPSVAVAQVTAPSPAGVAELERVVVTGSTF
jgi:hypothetical protein